MSKSKSSVEGSFKYLIQERIKNFWGYGNLNSDIWFVGMEEGYNENNEVLFERFKATAHGEVFDVYEDLKVDPGHVFWFKEGAPTQPTYRPLIFILLFLKTNKIPTLEEIRQFQIHNFGRKNSNHAILELMPLPSKSTRQQDWHYGNLGILELSSRRKYLEIYKEKRCLKLKELIDQYKPKIVIFYSLGYIQDWQRVTGLNFVEISKKIFITKNHNTLYVAVFHPIYFGLTKKYWEEVARVIANNLS